MIHTVKVDLECGEYFEDLIPDDLLNDIYYSSTYCLGAVDDGDNKILGVIVFDIFYLGNGKEEYKCQIRHIEVAEDERQKGIGSCLFRELSKICKETDIERICCIIDDENNEAAKSFFQKLGFKLESVSEINSILHIRDFDLLFEPMITEIGIPGFQFKSIGDLSFKQVNEGIWRLIRDNSWDRRVPDYKNDPFLMDISSVLMKRGRIAAIILIREDLTAYDAPVLDIVFFRLLPTVPSPVALGFLFLTMAKIYDAYDADTKLHVKTSVKSAIKILLRLNPDHREYNILKGYYLPGH